MPNKLKSQNKGNWATKKIHKNLNFFSFHFLVDYIFSKWKALINFIWISNVKVMENLIFGQS